MAPSVRGGEFTQPSLHLLILLGREWRRRERKEGRKGNFANSTTAAKNRYAQYVLRPRAGMQFRN